MTFSVVIPAYNAAPTIVEALNGVPNQTLKPAEILVFDDGSTDGTAALLETFKPAVTVFAQSNHRVVYARNFLCARARGDILAFLHADDIWHSCYLEVQQRMVEAYPAAVGYFTEHTNLVGYGWYRFQRRSANLPLHPSSSRSHRVRQCIQTVRNPKPDDWS